jgi:hypothetical protein
MRVQLMLDLPPPKPDQIRKPVAQQCSIEDDIRTLIEMIDSDYESNVEWKALNGFYQQLASMKKTPRVENLKKMIKPVLSKYGFHVE